MELKFIRIDNAIETKLIINGDEQNFEYLMFINKLIDGERIENVIYPNDITEDEKKEIEDMIAKINQILTESHNER